jgi:glutaredoxin
LKIKSTTLAHVARRGVLLLGVLPLPLTAPHAETLYKSITPDGRVLYSDHPPAQGRVVKTMVPDAAPSTALPASAAEQLRKLRALFPTAAPTSGVVLYSAVWCGYCKKAKAYLAGKGVTYQEVDIDTADGLAAYAQAGGGKGVPLLLAGGQRVQGFSPAAYDEVLANKK